MTYAANSMSKSGVKTTVAGSTSATVPVKAMCRPSYCSRNRAVRNRLSSKILLDFTDRSIIVEAMNAKSDTKTRILHTARELFHGRSYADVGIKEICDLAEVQKGSFYYFFSSKQDLAMAVIDDMVDDWARGFFTEALDQNLPPLDRLNNLIDAAYDWQLAVKDQEGRMPGCLFGNLALEVSTHNDALRGKLNAVFKKVSSLFRQILDEAVDRGDIPPLDTEATAGAMLAFLEGVILLAKTQNDPDVVRRLGPAIQTLRIELNKN